MIRNTIEFKTTATPITEAVTKFGGQPNWLEEPQWPISAELDAPMRFICQIKLTEDRFPGCEGKMAYIFMTEDEEYVDGTWKPDGGENAVIIQPNGIHHVPVRNIATGPSLQNYIMVEGEELLQPVDVELSVVLTESEEPDFMSQAKRYDLPLEEHEEYFDALEGNKIGGAPCFLQGDEFPDEQNEWMLLLQLDACDVPFSVNLGDSGVAYAFIRKDGTSGKFLWQCS